MFCFSLIWTWVSPEFFLYVMWLSLTGSFGKNLIKCLPTYFSNSNLIHEFQVSAQFRVQNLKLHAFCALLITMNVFSRSNMPFLHIHTRVHMHACTQVHIQTHTERTELPLLMYHIDLENYVLPAFFSSQLCLYFHPLTPTPSLPVPPSVQSPSALRLWFWWQGKLQGIYFEIFLLWHQIISV